MTQSPYDRQNEDPRRPARRRGRLRRFFRRVFLLVLCLALAFLAVRFGPNLYRRFFGDGNTSWISERFGEQLKEKNELVVYEATLTGQETVSQSAWLIGDVQQVIVPYSFTISFVVDLSRANVSVKSASDTIEVTLPAPEAKYPKLTVDETKMKKYDLLYPLTPERYADIKAQIEKKLTDECANKQEYLDLAWETAVKNMESLFKTVAEQSKDGVTCTISVTQATVIPSASPDQTEVSATPKAS